MKTKNLLIILIALGTITMTSCNKKKLFEQPTIEVTGYTLLELPGDYTYLEIDMSVTNNDDREAHIKDVEYQVVIEGVTSETMESTVDKDILIDTPLELTLPLTLATNDAIQLLAKLDAGEELSYTATGTFHVDDPILKLFDLPIDVSGSALVDAGFEDFYEQPEVTVDEISGTFSDEGATHKFDFDVTCTVQNMDTRGVTVDKVDYVVFIEGIESEAHTYSSTVVIDGSGTVSLTLPVTLNVTEAEGETLAAAINDGNSDYVVEGTFHVINLDGTVTDFVLPLYITGNTAVDLGDFFEQPTIEITGYSLIGEPGEYTNLEIDMIVTNNDTRSAFITDVSYQVEIASVIISEIEQEDINQTLEAGTPLNLTLPLTLLTNDAIQLLTILDTGGSLDYHATGTFHVNDPVLDLFDFPIDITGTATVDAGLDDFYKQPETTVTGISGTHTVNGFTSITFNLDVDCTVQNMDTRAVEIDEVEYVVFVEGQESNTHLYSTAYPATTISIAGSGSVNLTLPVTLTLSYTQGLALISALNDGTVDYIVEGIFHAISVDGYVNFPVDGFFLPLYDEGTVDASLITK